MSRNHETATPATHSGKKTKEYLSTFSFGLIPSKLQKEDRNQLIEN